MYNEKRKYVYVPTDLVFEYYLSSTKNYFNNSINDIQERPLFTVKNLELPRTTIENVFMGKKVLIFLVAYHASFMLFTLLFHFVVGKNYYPYYRDIFSFYMYTGVAFSGVIFLVNLFFRNYVNLAISFLYVIIFWQLWFTSWVLVFIIAAVANSIILLFK
jgi:hypothetical protein